MVTAPDSAVFPPAASSRALVPFVAAAPFRGAAPRALRGGLVLALLGLAAGAGALGTMGARHVLTAWSTPTADPQAAMLHRLQDQVARLQTGVDSLRVAADSTRSDESLRGLRRSVETVKQDLEQVRSNGAATTAQIVAKLDKVDHDPSARLADIAARLDRIEHAAASRQADAAAPKPDLVARLDRLEKQVASAGTTGTVAPAAHGAAQTSVQPRASAQKPDVAADSKPVAKVASVDGWILRDVYDGVALVQARGGELREVAPGEYLPGVGEVRSIERRGRGWVLLTSRGVIDPPAY